MRSRSDGPRDDERRSVTFAIFSKDANRANVSFYPVDPRGLPAVDSDIGPGQPLPPALDRAVLQQRIDTLRILAENTDGIALVNSNDLDKQMRRLAADLRVVYLIGYSSTNAKLDGGFRTIKVKVSRPRVEVRARHGYRAASAAELAAAQRGRGDGGASRKGGTQRRARPARP